MSRRKILIDSWKDAAIEFLKRGERLDGRGLEEYREIEVNVGCLENSEGSAIVKIGETLVSTGVKIDVGEPFPDSPNKGFFIVAVELTPLADEEFEPGPPGPNAIELARVVDRTLREANILDLEKLCIKEGELVWKIFIDIYVYSNDGNLFDAAYLSSLLALKSAKFPKLEEDRVLYGEKTEENLPLLKENVFLVTLGKIDNYFIVDPSKLEEEICDVILHVGTDGDRIYSLQMRGSGGMSKDEILKAVNISKKIVRDIFINKKWKVKEELLL